MEEVWIADRSTLRHLLLLHPSWTHLQFADCLHRSLSWVKKWRKRFAQAAPNDLAVVFGLSRARHTPIPPMDERIERAILDIRDQPPEHLGRVPGRHPLSSTTCLVAPNSSSRMCACRAPRAPSGKSCAVTTACSRRRCASSDPWNDLVRVPRDPD